MIRRNCLATQKEKLSSLGCPVGEAVTWSHINSSCRCLVFIRRRSSTPPNLVIWRIRMFVVYTAAMWLENTEILSFWMAMTRCPHSTWRHRGEHYRVSTGEHYQIYQAKGHAHVLIVPTAETAREMIKGTTWTYLCCVPYCCVTCVYTHPDGCDLYFKPGPKANS